MHVFYYLFILFITFLSINAHNYDILKPMLNVESIVDIDLGSNFTIKCESVYELDWEIRRNYIVIEFPENIYITHSNYSDREIYKHESTLQIINAKVNDSGFYICINKNRYNDLKAFVYVFVNDLNNLFLPEFISKYPIVLYKNRAIPCLPSISTLNVTLWKGNESVNLFEKSIEFIPWKGFIIKNPNSYFNGIFICKVVYKNYTQEISFNIIGKNLKPPVSNLGPIVNILVNSTLELNCTGESPLLWIKPNHSNSKTEEDIVYKEYKSDDRNYVAELKIENIRYFHTGLYSCCYPGNYSSTYCGPKNGVQVYVFVNDPDNIFISDKDHPLQSQYQCVRDVVYCLPTFSNLTMKLKKGNEYIPIGKNVSFDPRFGFLFYDPQPFSYVYTCIAEYGSNIKEKKISSVTLEDKHDMYIYLSNSRPIENDEVQIVCEVCSYNYKDIVWSWKDADGKNEAMINKENHLGIKIIAESIIGRKRQILKFDSIKPNHSGIYQCIGLSKNGLSNGIKTALLKVIALKKPFFIDTNMNGSKLLLHLGIHYDFYCFVEGIPLPTVSWYKDGKLIKQELPGIEFYENFQILRINPIIEEDYGVYSCKAKSDLGFITGEVTVDIQTGKQFAEFLIAKNNLSRTEIFLISLFVILLIFLLSSTFILMKYIRKLKKIDSEEEEMCIPEMIEIDQET